MMTEQRPLCVVISFKHCTQNCFPMCALHRVKMHRNVTVIHIISYHCVRLLKLACVRCSCAIIDVSLYLVFTVSVPCRFLSSSIAWFLILLSFFPAILLYRTGLRDVAIVQLSNFPFVSLFTVHKLLGFIRETESGQYLRCVSLSTA